MNMRNWVANAIASPVKQPLPILSFPSAQLLNVSVRELVCSLPDPGHIGPLVAVPVNGGAPLIAVQNHMHMAVSSHKITSFSHGL